MSELYRQADLLLASPQCRQAFDLSQESDKVRDRYGRFRSGQACLLARRLVEAGVPLVTVFLNQSVRGQDSAPGVTDAYGWDTHNDIFDAMRDHLLPRFDICFSALLEDLRNEDSSIRHWSSARANSAAHREWHVNRTLREARLAASTGLLSTRS